MDALVDQRKRELRNRFRKLRKDMAACDRIRVDVALSKMVLSLPEFKCADVLLSYLSFGTEVETRGIIQHAWESGKVVALPRCVPDSREMRWFRVESLDDLVRSSLGVLEPALNCQDEQDPNDSRNVLAIVPGLTFDEIGYRLGYGGGYYDAFLSTFAGVSVGLCREAQMSPTETIPIDCNDLPVQVVVTENVVLRSKKYFEFGSYPRSTTNPEALL